jgi:hypothetical protein
MFFCTVVCTLFRVADKTDKAAETPAVTCYPAALTAGILLKQKSMGEMRLFLSTVYLFFFAPQRLKKKSS